jgi:hypothetical protein
MPAVIVVITKQAQHQRQARLQHTRTVIHTTHLHQRLQHCAAETSQVHAWQQLLHAAQHCPLDLKRSAASAGCHEAHQRRQQQVQLLFKRHAKGLQAAVDSQHYELSSAITVER